METNIYKLRKETFLKNTNCLHIYGKNSKILTSVSKAVFHKHVYKNLFSNFIPHHHLVSIQYQDKTPWSKPVVYTRVSRIEMGHRAWKFLRPLKLQVQGMRATWLDLGDEPPQKPTKLINLLIHCKWNSF